MEEYSENYFKNFIKYIIEYGNYEYRYFYIILGGDQPIINNVDKDEDWLYVGLRGEVVYSCLESPYYFTFLVKN